MRILFIIHQFMPEFAAGTERATFNLAKSAQRDGHHVEVLTSSLLPGAEWSQSAETGLRSTSVEGLRVYGVRAFEPKPLQDLGFERDDQAAWKRLLDRTSYDLVHVTHGMRMLEVIEALGERHIPYVITLTDFFLACWRINLVRASGTLCSGPAGGTACLRHCSTPQLDAHRVFARRERMSRILEAAAGILACSDSVAAVFRAEYPDLAIRVIEHGIDLLQFTPAQPRSPAGSVTFGYVGTFSEAKGVHVLAEAFARAAPPRANLKLIGPSYDEAVTQRIGEIAGTCPGIAIHPPVPAHDIPSLLGTFDVLCLPSMVPETFSLAVHEGFAAGLPALVSDLGHPAFVVRRFGCGDTIPAGDVRAWADAICRVASQPELLAGWAANVPLPMRVEEEGFLYSQVYRAVTHQRPRNHVA